MAEYMSKNGYDEHQHGGIQVLPSDGLMLHRPIPGLEVVHDASDEQKQPLPIVSEVKEVPPITIAEDIVQEEVNGSAKKARISRKCLWALIAVLLIIVAAAVGGGVGGIIAEKNSKSSLLSPGPPSTSTPTSTLTSTLTSSSGEQQHPTSAAPSVTSSGQQSSTSTITSTPTSPSNSVYWGQDLGVEIGCYIDDAHRFLRGPNFTDASSMTPQLCAGLCSDYSYFGLEDGSQCFCGNLLTSGYSETTHNDCDVPCPGDSTALCGNVWRIDVYQLAAVDPPVRTYNSLGCHGDGEPRTLQGPEYQNQWMTPELCAGLCNGYTYFGVEYYEQCFCGDEYNSTYLTLTSGCEYPCKGDSQQNCGGYWQIDLYQFE